MTAARQPLHGGLARAAAAREARLIGYRWIPGRVAVGHIRNLNQQPGNTDRRRPLILIGQVDTDPGVWRVAGLTTNPTAADGTPRCPVEDWERIPLTGPAWYWSARLAYVPTEDLLRPVGWVTDVEVASIARRSRITHGEYAALCQAAALYRGGRGEL